VEFGGWLWRYDLAPLGTSETEVTLTYDWSAVPQFRREYIQFPPFGPDHLPNSLHHLAELAATASQATDYDAELRRHDEVLRRACGVQVHDHVLDIGCGSGRTTRQAARTAREGSALGVDASGPAIERARDLARADGLPNVTFEHADAQVHGFPVEGFDLAISRFGTMFFEDPVVAFANIGRALRPGGRLVMLVWQARERNEWAVAIRQCLGTADVPVAGASGEPDAFSLADPPTVKELLQTAGFADIAFADVHEPVFYGSDVASALNWVRGFTCTSEVLNRLDPAAATRAVERLSETFAAHLSDDGVWFDSRAWLVTASTR
jgi:SAM-dependent methyltransferase